MSSRLLLFFVLLLGVVAVVGGGSLKFYETNEAYRVSGVMSSRLLNDIAKLRPAFDLRHSAFYITIGNGVFALMFSFISDWRLTLYLLPLLILV